MSLVSSVATTQPSISLTTIKSATQKIPNQPQPMANTSSVTISPTAMNRAYYEQSMAEVTAGYIQIRAQVQSDPSSPIWTPYADTVAHSTIANEIGYDYSQTLPPGDGLLRYTSGEPVTPESQAYLNQQATSFQKQKIELYNSEMAKKTPAGDILMKMLDLQGQQPERFRAMMMWPNAADFANSQPGTASGGVKLS